MLFALIRKEIINNVLSFRFMVTLVLFFGLILISIMFLTSDHQTRLRTHEASKSAHRDQILSFKGAEDQDERFHEIQTKSETSKAVEALWVSVEIIIPSAENSDT